MQPYQKGMYEGKIVVTKLMDNQGNAIEERSDRINIGPRYKTLSRKNDPNWSKVKTIVCYVDGVVVREAQIDNEECDCGCMNCWLFCTDNIKA